MRSSNHSSSNSDDISSISEKYLMDEAQKDHGLNETCEILSTQRSTTITTLIQTIKSSKPKFMTNFLRKKESPKAKQRPPSKGVLRGDLNTTGGTEHYTLSDHQRRSTLKLQTGGPIKSNFAKNQERSSRKSLEKLDVLKLKPSWSVMIKPKLGLTIDQADFDQCYYSDSQSEDSSDSDSDDENNIKEGRLSATSLLETSKQASRKNSKNSKSFAKAQTFKVDSMLPNRNSSLEKVKRKRMSFHINKAGHRLHQSTLNNDTMNFSVMSILKPSSYDFRKKKTIQSSNPRRTRNANQHPLKKRVTFSKKKLVFKYRLRKSSSESAGKDGALKLSRPSRLKKSAFNNSGPDLA